MCADDSSVDTGHYGDEREVSRGDPFKLNIWTSKLLPSNIREHAATTQSGHQIFEPKSAAMLDVADFPDLTLECNKPPFVHSSSEPDRQAAFLRLPEDTAGLRPSPVRCLAETMMAVGCHLVLAGTNRLDGIDPHQPAYPALAAIEPSFLQFHRHARAAPGLRRDRLRCQGSACTARGYAPAPSCPSAPGG